MYALQVWIGALLTLMIFSFLYKDNPFYKLAEHINNVNGRHIIPADVLTRPPSAELRPDQKDIDSLPDYNLLDRILKGYV